MKEFLVASETQVQLLNWLYVSNMFEIFALCTFAKTDKKPPSTNQVCSVVRLYFFSIYLLLCVHSNFPCSPCSESFVQEVLGNTKIFHNFQSLRMKIVDLLSSWICEELIFHNYEPCVIPLWWKYARPFRSLTHVLVKIASSLLFQSPWWKSKPIPKRTFLVPDDQLRDDGWSN